MMRAEYPGRPQGYIAASGLDRNRSAVLKVASSADEDQVEAVADIARARAEKLKRWPRSTSSRSAISNIQPPASSRAGSS
jgi:hypothetical protein